MQRQEQNLKCGLCLIKIITATGQAGNYVCLFLMLQSHFLLPYCDSKAKDRTLNTYHYCMYMRDTVFLSKRNISAAGDFLFDKCWPR